MKKEEIEALVLIILVVELALFLWIVFLLAGSNTTCESYCNSHGTIFSEIKHTGEWGNDDLCVCYKEDNSIITWRMPK